MEHIHFDHLNARSIVFVVLAIAAGIFMFKATKHLLFGLVFTVLGLGLVAWGFDIVSLDDAKAMAAKVKADAQEGIDAASMRAKMIGEQGHSTSAGSGSQTNDAYKKHVENK